MVALNSSQPDTQMVDARLMESQSKNTIVVFFLDDQNLPPKYIYKKLSNIEYHKYIDKVFQGLELEIW